MGIMANKKEKTAPTWSDVKSQLISFEKSNLIALVKDLYASNADNKNFLHARLEIGVDVLQPYKFIIERWISPDLYKGHNYSISKAKKPISDYNKAAGRPEGVAELAIFYCENAISFSNEFGVDDDSYYSALCLMFVQALDAVMLLPKNQREDFIDRLHDVMMSARDFGWGVYDECKEEWKKAGLELDD
jgi:hypothetical protein